MAKMLATNTNYATMVSTPKAQTNRIKFVQLSVLEEKSLLCTVVSDKNHVVNKIVKVSKDVNQEIVVRLNVALNTVLAGLSIEEINLGVMTTLASQAGEFESVVSEVLKAITEAIATEEQMKIYTSGATNIFKYPELSDKERASQLLTTLEEKSQLTELINEGDEETGIQVYIGSESPVPVSYTHLDVYKRQEEVDALSFIVPEASAYERGRKMCEKLKTEIPRQLFEVPIQAAVGLSLIHI